MRLIVCNASWVVIRYDFVFGLWLFEFGWGLWVSGCSLCLVVLLLVVGACLRNCGFGFGYGWLCLLLWLFLLGF